MDRREVQPPKWAIRLLRLYCKPESLEIIEGDIYELFEKRLVDDPKKARRKFGWDVLRFFRLKYIKGLSDYNSLNNITMFKNYFKISIRSLYKHKFYSLINISGLSIGLAACMLIVLYISNEVSYDKFHQDSERIYRMANGQNGNWTPASLGIQAKMDFPEIEEIVRISGPGESTFKLGDKVFRESQGFSADSTFHKIFSINFLEGNPDKALTQPNSVVLTASIAKKYFGNASAYGEFILIDGETTKVTGVISDPPKNTHFLYNFISSYPHESWVTVGNWTGNNFFTYAKLVPGASAMALEAKFPDFKRKYSGDQMLSYSEYDTYEELLANSKNVPTFTLKPMVDLHLYYPRFALGSNGDINNVYIFSAVAVFILLIASINFMNLSTARSAARAKEVGMRKVLGSLRKQLISQFLVESLIISLFAMVLSLGLASLFLDVFNELANRNFNISDLLVLPLLIKLVSLSIVIGLLAGCYPAFYLSGFKPIKALKGEIKVGNSNAFIRKGLVAFQFAISIFLIISTTVVFKQLNFLNSQKLGFNTEQVLVVDNTFSLKNNLASFKNNVLRSANIEDVTFSDNYLSGWLSDWGYQTLGEDAKSGNFMHLFANSNYFSTMGIELKEGRFFSDDLVSDSASIIVNEVTAKWFGGETAVGQMFTRGDGERLKVIGVVKDFHYGSLKNNIEPMIIRYLAPTGQIEAGWWGANHASIKVTGNYQTAIEEIESAWNLAVADEPFDAFFLNDSFNQLYDEERRFGKLFTASASLAIIIASLGLFALAAFTLERRLKEIAVRKVLGASTSKLTMLIITDFTKLVLLGAIIAIPVGYFVMDAWLSDFAYQMKIGVLTLILPALAVAALTWITVGVQSVKSALANPIKALRSE